MFKFQSKTYKIDSDTHTTCSNVQAFKQTSFFLLLNGNDINKLETEG